MTKLKKAQKQKYYIDILNEVTKSFELYFVRYPVPVTHIGGRNIITKKCNIKISNDSLKTDLSQWVEETVNDENSDIKSPGIIYVNHIDYHKDINILTIYYMFTEIPNNYLGQWWL